MKCDPQVVEDFILDSPKQIELINDFTKKGNLFYYQKISTKSTGLHKSRIGEVTLGIS